MSRQRIAIVGSGISGLSCAHFLHPHHDISVFEGDVRIGGHSNTVSVPEGDRRVEMDTGFMVYNEVTYPLLTKLFAKLEVKTKPTSMSFSVQQVRDRLEFNGGSLNLLFGQRKNLLRPRFWKMLAQIDRFNRETVEELNTPANGNLSLAEYVASRGYGDDFLQWYLVPMAAAVWSSPPERIREFPARTLMRFWHNHGFLGLDTQHPWRTVVGGSRHYVERLSQPFAGRIFTGKGVRQITDDRRLVFGDGTSSETFDRIVIAAHGDQALEMIQSPTALERQLLKPFVYQNNDAVVHTDESVMPETRRCWASWNYRVEGARHSTHYWMNSLQGVSDRENYFVSINPTVLDPSRILRRMQYRHPLFDLDAVAAQDCLPELHQEGDRTGRFFCGAWQRYGFHEDGIWSADRLCRHLLEGDPWL